MYIFWMEVDDEKSISLEKSDHDGCKNLKYGESNTSFLN